MKSLRSLNDVSDIFVAFAAMIVVVLGTLLAAALLIGAPGLLTWTLIRAGRPVLGGLVAALLALAIFGVVRDLRAGRMSWLSAVLAALWTLCVAYVGIRMVMA